MSGLWIDEERDRGAEVVVVGDVRDWLWWMVDDDGLVAASIFEWSLKVLLSGVFSLSIECSMIVRFVSCSQSDQSDQSDDE